MRILFDLTPLYDHLSGIERYNANISKSIIEGHPENYYILVFKNEIFRDFKEIAEKTNVETIVLKSCNKLLFIQGRLFNVVRKIAADYYIFLSFTSPILLKKKGIVNAIHDLTCWDFPESIPFKMQCYYRLSYYYAVKRSKYIITVSKFSQNRICERYNISKEYIKIIYDGLSEIFKTENKADENMVRNKYNLPETFFLSLSTIEPRKNIQLLIQSYQELIMEGHDLPDLVLAGRMGWKLEKIIGELNEKAKNKIKFTGFIDDNDLPILYSMATLFIFPSLYEGFGLPVIEAMSQGTLVLCSDAASLPEIAGEDGVLFKSNNKEALKNKILDILCLPEETVASIISKAKRSCKKYNWKTEAQKLYMLLEADDKND